MVHTTVSVLTPAATLVDFSQMVDSAVVGVTTAGSGALVQVATTSLHISVVVLTVATLTYKVEEVLYYLASMIATGLYLVAQVDLLDPTLWVTVSAVAISAVTAVLQDLPLAVAAVDSLEEVEL